MSRQQLDRLIDTKLYSKSVLIFNTVNDVTVRKNVFSKNLRICYVGSTDKKRFLRVKDIWKQLRKQKVKNIEFHVIGGDNLYNTSNRNDIPYYCDKEEIFYHGIVGGAEKIELMKTMNLGIIFSKRETFGLASIEFQALGIPVVALKSYGMIDTIIDKKTGFLVNNKYLSLIHI
ncbi:hypothetical protein A5844_000536 [Enterococcus sp. 10A9_DIV0425]|uniref:Glycosyl transferase family 1 domain-containing protein n=1 Tax=Candidatus Enterococcus wittei TaxID=1987383 RepID=A0A2C9XSA7_9ENTE|nr:glycosyltransferase [Enterococcus sp. 10A9_DIV0425]OTP12304.1 hypothetical protein A5844_000536 [Enterococcus sp. 10A9_DIV0425]